ncbi:hypothetical protein R1sor_021517 [Riccia sorocarpa]|uniref:Uncharacterized protein n=1 Tax=Riccia sorocarpa TaxID=122646 RepID=A0ABD3GIQ8_9MARC
MKSHPESSSSPSGMQYDFSLGSRIPSVKRCIVTSPEPADAQWSMLLGLKRRIIMPKDPSSRSLLSPKSRGTLCRPYPSQGKGVSQGSCSKEGEETVKKDWEDSTCPICMEYPHNAVLLLCSSHDKGCRPYMCDTSYRHSNCLDQFRKAKSVSDKLSDRGTEPPIETGLPTSLSDGSAEENRRHSFRPFGAAIRGLMRRDDGLNTAPAGSMLRSPHPQPIGLSRITREQILNGASLVGPRGLQMLNAPERVIGAEVLPDGVESPVIEVNEGRPSGGGVGSEPNGELQDLLCPLCRGKVFGWKVVEAARHQLNRKPRSCAQESCSFSGTYKELREHARAVHPTARPSDIDPARQRDWRRLERQRDLGDVLSTIRSAMPGATVLGDYVIEEEEEDHEDDGDDSDFPGDDGNWWTVFLLFQVFGPAAPFAGGRGFPGRMSRLTRGPSNPMMRQALWGETFQANGMSGAVTSHTGTSIFRYNLTPFRCITDMR